MKAINPISVRPVKVKTLNGMDEMQVQEQMFLNSSKGLVPQWEEMPEADTPELDTETIFPEKTLSGKFLNLHQVTVPLSVEDFPQVLNNRTATEVLQYIQLVCHREGWSMEYRNIVVVMNQLEMDLE